MGEIISTLSDADGKVIHYLSLEVAFVRQLVAESAPKDSSSEENGEGLLISGKTNKDCIEDLLGLRGWIARLLSILNGFLDLVRVL